MLNDQLFISSILYLVMIHSDYCFVLPSDAKLHIYTFYHDASFIQLKTRYSELGNLTLINISRFIII